MTNIYKLTIEPVTSFGTPLQSDTIFGHLMWALRYREGEEALAGFLDLYRAGKPPLLVSAGFPAGTLPAPVLRVGRGQKVGAYLPLRQWREIAPRLSGDALWRAHLEAREEVRTIRDEEVKHGVVGTAVDRITGSAREGRLFVSMETFYGPQRRFEIWHKVDETEEGLLDRLAVWWRWVERNGFGRGKSRGHGAFRIEEKDGQMLEPADGQLPQVAQPNGFVTLSAWVPEAGDPTNVTYRTRIKRGKLAEARAIPSPWKKPLLMLEPGAVARLGKQDGDLRQWYGRLVEDVHWTEHDVVQYGYAFPLPVRVERGA